MGTGTLFWICEVNLWGVKTEKFRNWLKMEWVIFLFDFFHFFDLIWRKMVYVVFDISLHEIYDLFIGIFHSALIWSEEKFYIAIQ